MDVISVWMLTRVYHIPYICVNTNPCLSYTVHLCELLTRVYHIPYICVNVNTCISWTWHWYEGKPVIVSKETSHWIDEWNTVICINKLQLLSGVDQKFLQIAIITIIQLPFEKTEGTMKNGHSRDTGNIEHTKHTTNTNKTRKHRKPKRWRTRTNQNRSTLIK
jgi:hypothetical protein